MSGDVWSCVGNVVSKVASLREEVGRGGGRETRETRETREEGQQNWSNRLYLTREIDQLKEQVCYFSQPLFHCVCTHTCSVYVCADQQDHYTSCSIICCVVNTVQNSLCGATYTYIRMMFFSMRRVEVSSMAW